MANPLKRFLDDQYFQKKMKHLDSEELNVN